MLSVRRPGHLMQGKVAFLAAFLVSVSLANAGETEKTMKPYTEKIANTDVTFDMVPIPGGEFVLGSPAGEKKREDDEGPQIKVKIEPFWMGKHEVTWNEYDVWSFNLDIQRRKLTRVKADAKEKAADAVTRPTKPYTDMTFDMGHDGYPAICMTQLAAKTYCKWLSEKTGHYYRLPTEAEWEYACRAGTTTAYSFGDDPSKLDDYAWHYANCNDTYQKVGKKKPNPWGLYDMHGNVSEWVLDQYIPDAYKKWSGKGTLKFPVNVPTKLYPRIVRGGSWDDEPEELRSANRIYSSSDWKIQDPQLPQSIWYHTDAIMVGFRVVRPLKVPTAEERKKYNLDPIIPADEGR
ncbi:formylglycine-generating enzyme family protein [Gimesia aquarii]|uniref:Serine/threonine-protein kinase pkn1 n=1 Tax=Gimesia aquarii TaxID=2527964 RepID=A0A517VU66_9PLAN|nr:formylglycine-generating enzyme family protein [Gimesia aquarii]QDT96547.1 Serine/threonine-protein kinase pkn1 [Gimesia aquarii]QDU07689.1 Serine/threonine-protein kinase pkn1 [Gimesia aquarii]